jgi:hypothetical protein
MRIDDGRERDAVAFLLDVLNDRNQPYEQRYKAAQSLLPLSRDPLVAERIGKKARETLSAVGAGKDSHWEGPWGNDLDPGSWTPPPDKRH